MLTKFSQLHRVVAFVLSASVVWLAGCSAVSENLPDRRVDYKKGRVEGNPLELPPTESSSQFDPQLVVPSADGTGTARYSEFASGGGPVLATGRYSNVLPAIEAVRLRKDGQLRWLEVDGSIERVWDRTREFWAEQGFKLIEADPAAGVMVTGFKENRADIADDFITRTIRQVADFAYSAATRDQYRVRIERGASDAIAEVYLTHRGLEEVVTRDAGNNADGTIWKPRDTDPVLEAEMIARLQAHLGQQEVADRRAAGATQASESLTKFEADAASPLIHVATGFDRAWRMVGLALDRSGYVIEDRDRSLGNYYVRFIETDVVNAKEDEGFLSKLAFWRSSKKPKVEDAPLYVVNVRGDRERSRVSVLDGNAQAPSTAADAKTLLTVVYGALN